MFKRAWLNEAILRRERAMDYGSIDQTCQIPRRGNARIPKTSTCAGWLVAMNTVGMEVGANAVFGAHGRIGNVGECRQRVQVWHRLGEIAGAAQRFDLILRCSAITHLTVQLRGIEAKGVTSRLGVALQTLRTARIPPNLSSNGIT